jgi:hypothetical protein
LYFWLLLCDILFICLYMKAHDSFWYLPRLMCLLPLKFVLVVSFSRFFPHSWLIAGFVTRATRWVALVEQYLLTISSSPWVFSGNRVAQSLVFWVMFCRLLFVLLSFIFWPLRFLSFDLRTLINPLVFSNFSLYVTVFLVSYWSVSYLLFWTLKQKKIWMHFYTDLFFLEKRNIINISHSNQRRIFKTHLFNCRFFNISRNILFQNWWHVTFQNIKYQIINILIWYDL